MTKEIPKKGFVREDGFIFIKMNRHSNGKEYPMFMSPLALEKQRQRVREWRANNLDYSRELVRAWQQRRRDLREAKKTEQKEQGAIGSPKTNKNEQKGRLRAKGEVSRECSGIPNNSISRSPRSSAKNKSSAKMAPTGNGIGVGLVPLVPFQGIPLRGIYPIKLAPLGTTTNPHSVPFAELAPEQSNKKINNKSKNQKKYQKNKIL